MLPHRRTLAVVVLLFSVLLQGCMSTQSQPQSEGKLLVKCEEPRPEICTQQYTPVCGYSNKAMKTYSNGCSACADRTVTSYSEGVCL